MSNKIEIIEKAAYMKGVNDSREKLVTEAEKLLANGEPKMARVLAENSSNLTKLIS